MTSATPTAPLTAASPTDFAEFPIDPPGRSARATTAVLRVAFGLTAVAIAAGGTAFVTLGDSWWQLLVATLFAVIFTQIGFLGHDAGHRQVFTGARANDVIGYVLANLLIGLSFGWWMAKHNAHHANPNHTERDPDVRGGALAFTQEQAKPRRGLRRAMARHQAVLFFPLLLLEAANLHLSSVTAIRRRGIARPRLEAGLLLVHTVAYLVAVFAVLSPVVAVVFVAVHQGLFGLYLGCSFAPNHKGMPMLSEADERDPLRKQVLTARNVIGSPFINVALGGLNYQIEHHLFPRMPRPTLRRAQPRVREFCRDRGIPYVECGLFDSYAQALRALHAVGAPLRP